MPLMSTIGTSELRWIARFGGHLELLALIVGADIARRFDPHPLGRVLDLLLVEDEADVALLVERREREHRDQHADRARQRDLGPADEPVVARCPAPPSAA